MKVNKFFMLGLAGLAFAACSNEEEIGNQFPDGNGAVSVRILNPAVTRSITGGTTGAADSQVKLKGELIVTVTYTDSEGQHNKSIVYDVDNRPETGDIELKFWNITRPTKITASINGGIVSYASTSINATTPNMQAAPENIPAYGETSTINDATEKGTPNLNNQYDGRDKSKTETGAQSGDELKEYMMYEATINMDIPVARLEVSDISHESHSDTDACEYTNLTIIGAYMDNLLLTAGAAGPTNYCWGGPNTNTGIGAVAILKDAVNEESGSDFKSGSFPSDGQAFAYNFYPGTTNPVFKIYFKATESGKTEVESRYAMITEYKDGDGNPVVMEKGHIYRVTKATLTDENVVGYEDELVYGLSVTVVEAKWTIVDLNVTWATE